jgi:preflagellin peptidase FlaK
MDDMIIYLNIARLISGFLILLYASYTDFKTRTASNVLWIIMIIIGFFLLFIQFLLNGIENILNIVFIPILIIIFYFLFQLLPFFGGADAKALISLAILVPFEPTIAIFPMWNSIMPFAWIILSNSVFIYLVIPFSLYLYNIAKKNFDFPNCFLGYKIDLNMAKDKFVWPLEKFEDGKRKISYFSMNKNVKDIYDKFEENGISKIWVTPKIPFMIPLLVGFLLSFFIGDILFYIMSLFL